MRSIALIAMLLKSFFMLAQQPEGEIRQVLDNQVACWNKGDLECFMDGYWKSDQLVFIGKSGVTYGWEPVYNNYKKSYPDKGIMGELKFDIKEISVLSDEVFFVIGAWELTRSQDNPSGYFSLVFKRLNGKWVIISDHSS